MNRKQAAFAIILPVTGALLLLGWSLAYPLVESIVSGESSNFLRYVIFGHIAIQMFGIPAWIWVGAALICFTIGLRLVFKAAREPVLERSQVLGFALAMVPWCVVGLGPFFAEYYGS